MLHYVLFLTYSLLCGTSSNNGNKGHPKSGNFPFHGTHLSPSNKEHNMPKGIYKTSCSKTILIKYKKQCKTKPCQTYCIVQYVQEQCALRFFKYSIPHTLLLLRKQASIFHGGSTLWKMALNPETHL